MAARFSEELEESEPYGSIFSYLNDLERHQSLMRPSIVDYECILQKLPPKISFKNQDLRNFTAENILRNVPRTLNNGHSKDKDPQADFNFSDLHRKKGKQAINNLKHFSIPQVKNHDAEQCYEDAKQL